MFKKILLVIILLLTSTKQVLAMDGQSNKARVIRILEQKEISIEDKKQIYQKVELKILNGEDKDKIIEIENGNMALANTQVYKVNEILLINKLTNPDGTTGWEIIDYVRTDGLILLTIIFVVLVVGISKIRGIMALLSMVITFGIVFWLILPQIVAGREPILVAILGAILIIPITFYMSHGFGKKTSIAVVGTIISMIVTGILAVIFINLGKLTGFSSEEAGMLTYMIGGLDMRGVLLAGIIIGAIGVLDDITIAQASVVEEIKEAAEKIRFWDLYKRSMKIGQDHISSMINTLILVYAGAAMPLMLIFVNNPHPLAEIVNYEFIAEEIIRTLTGSIGLIMAVPITTLLATKVFINQKNKVK